SWRCLSEVGIEGIALYAADGRPLADYGQRPTFGPPRASATGALMFPHDDDPVKRRFQPGGESFDIIWPSTVSGLPFTVVARLSTAELAAELNAYVLTIGGLVLVLSLFVAVVTVAVI